MGSRRKTGGLHDFVDDGSHNSHLTAEESARIDNAYARARKRRSSLIYKIRKFLTGKND